MTTVAADFESGVMVSDSKCTTGDVWTPTRKVWRHNGELIGVAGDLHQASKFLRWYTGGRKGPFPGKSGDFEAMILRPDGLFHVFESGLELKEERGFFAIGSGQKAALAILVAGLGAEKAVEIACQVDVGSGGDLQVFRLHD